MGALQLGALRAGAVLKEGQLPAEGMGYEGHTGNALQFLGKQRGQQVVAGGLVLCQGGNVSAQWSRSISRGWVRACISSPMRRAIPQSA